MNYADPTKLRAYFFGNMYLSQIQQGIQAAHVVTKMFAKYGREHEGVSALAGDTLFDWADAGMTKILLNGGYQSNLADIHRIFEIVCPKLGLPFSKFHEEEAALNGALTSVGIVVPEEIYGMLMDDKFHERYFNANIGDYYMISNPVAYNARIAVQAATATPAQILLNLETGGVSYEIQDYADALRVTLASARLA